MKKSEPLLTRDVQREEELYILLDPKSDTKRKGDEFIDLHAFAEWLPVDADRKAEFLPGCIYRRRVALIYSRQQAPVDTAVQTKTESSGLSVGERCAEKITAFLATPESRSFWATDDCSEIAAIINQEVGALQADKERLEKLYYELLLAVERKHDNETPHQTALRYIQQAESHDKSQVGQIDAAMKQNLEERTETNERMG